MRINSWLLMCLSLGICTHTMSAEPDKVAASIQWEENLETAMADSIKDGRPVIAYFTYDTCFWCKRLEKACFSEKEVVELSRKFHWVKINRDRTPKIPKRFNVSAYPSLLTFGDKYENVFRFKSYQEPPEFIGNLNESLKRHALYKSGKEWVLPPTRPDRIIDVGTVTTFDAPSDAVPSGITVFGESIWLAQGDLFQLNQSGKVVNKFKLPRSVGDLCHDGKVLYAVTYGWTAGKPIYVIDPKTGKVLREIVTEANKKNRAFGAKGIAYHNNRLFVLSGMRGKVHELDMESGEIKREIKLDGTWLSGFDIRDGRFVCGNREQLMEFDTESGKLIRKTASNYPLRNVAYDDDQILLMEQPVFGFGPKHERIQVWPQKTVIYRLTLTEGKR